MKTMFALAAGAVPLLATTVAMAQDGHMMDRGVWATGWMGGYGGLWVTTLAVLAVVGLVAWAERQVYK